MANVLVQESSLQDIASAIRSKNGTQNTYKPSQMADAITNLPSGGGTPTGTINITANGTHDVTNYASASVNVPNSYTSSDVGKVVNRDRQLVEQMNAQYTANGTYDTTLVGQVEVNVQGGSTSKGIYPLANGTHTFSNGTTVTVTNGSHVEITIASGNTEDGFIDLSDLSENSSNFNTSSNVQNHSAKFSISNGQKAYFMISNFTTVANCSFNAYGTGTTNVGMAISNLSTAYGEAIKTFTADTDVGCLFFVGKTAGNYSFDVTFIVSGSVYV